MMDLMRLKAKIKIPPVTAGYKRKWLKCKTCSSVVYRDYIPYSLSNPVMWLPCGHDAGTKVHEATTEISEKEALKLLERRA